MTTEFVMAVTIPPNAVESESIFLANRTPTGIVIPADFGGRTISFSVAHDGRLYFPLYTVMDILVRVAVTPGRAYQIEPGWFPYWPYLRLTVPASPALRTVYLMTRYI